MEAEHRSALLLFLVELEGANLPLSYRQRLRFISWQILGYRLDIKEDRLLSNSIMVFCMDDELTSILNL